MHPSTALSTVLVDELVRGGVREAVLCPGSRSAPLAYALEEADRAGRLRLHVRVDERSAAFLALGMARASGRAVPVVTTSGTAVANLHPAVLEAHHGGTPLVVVSADRPAELRGTGANQTTVQPGIFGGALRWEVDLPAPGRAPGQAASWRSTVCRALAAALDHAPGCSGWSRRGPVHLNVGLRDPLAPALEDVDGWPEPLDGRPDGGPWVRVAAPGETVAAAERTVVLVGDLPRPELTTAALDWAGAAGWPVLAEPFGTLSIRPHVVRHAPVVAARAADDPDLRPERVVVVGRLTLFRELGALLRLDGVVVEHVSAVPDWTDPSHVVQVVRGTQVLRQPPPARSPGADEWVRAWVGLGEELTEPVRAAVLADPARPTGPAVATTVAAALGDDDLLVLGSSNGPRDLATGLGLLEQRGAPRVVAGRGLAGIDGTVSTAVGVALAADVAVPEQKGAHRGDRPSRPAGRGRTVALMGDLTFLHDVNGLLVGTGEPRPDLTVVVVNDDGGGIFSTLEYGDPRRSDTVERRAATERLFGTPHGTDLAAACAAHHVEHHLVPTVDVLAHLLGRPDEGIRVLEVPVDRAGHRHLRDLLRNPAR